MQNIKYKRKFTNISISYSADFLQYKNSQITKNEIIKFGISLPINKHTHSYGFNKKYLELFKQGVKSKKYILIKDQNLKELGEKHFTKYCSLIITYTKNNDKNLRKLNIPLNLSNQTSIEFIENFIKNNNSKYIGVGQKWVMVKELNIPIKPLKFLLIIALFILGAMAINIFSGILPDFIKFFIIILLFIIIVIYQKK